MKKLYATLALFLCLCLLAGCAGPAGPVAPGPADSGQTPPTANPQVEQLHIWQADRIDAGLAAEDGWGSYGAAKSPDYLFVTGYRYDGAGGLHTMLARSSLDGSAPVQLPLPTPHAVGDASRFIGLAADGQNGLALLEVVYESDGTRSYWLHRLTADGTPVSAVLLDIPGEAYMGEWQMTATADGTCWLHWENNLLAAAPDGSCRNVQAAPADSNIWRVHAAGQYVYLQYYAWQQPGYGTLRLDTATGETLTLFESESDGGLFVTGDAAGTAWLYDTFSGIYSLEGGTPALVCDWLNSDIGTTETSLALLADTDGSFLALGRGDDWRGLTVARLRPADPAAIPQKTLVTLCGDGLRDRVLRFNRSSDTVRVVLTDHDIEYTDYIAPDGRTLTEQLAAGDGPDIIYHLSYDTPRQYAAAGYLADMYPLLDADGQLSREDFWPGPLAAGEVDGRLTTVLPTFGITTVAAPTALVGSTQGWSWQAFCDLLAADPGLAPFAQINRSDLVYYAMLFWGDSLYDPLTGACHFDTDAFADLLQLAATLPEATDYSTQLTDLLQSGAALGHITAISGVTRMQLVTDWFDREVTLKGFPGGAGQPGAVISESHMLSINAGCADKDAAWQFVASLLTAENQYADATGSLALRRDVLARQVADASVPYQLPPDADGPAMPWLGVPTDSEVAQLKALLEGRTPLCSYDYDLLTLLQQAVLPCFEGSATPAQAAAAAQAAAEAYFGDAGGA